MPIDERSDLDRLTRAQLYREADAHGIKYPPDMPKYLYKGGSIVGGMIAILQSNGIDSRHKMKTIKWQTIYPSEQERAAAAHQGGSTSEQSYPIQELHQSARDGVDSSSILTERLAQSAAKNDLQSDEITRLRADNERMRRALSRMDEIEERLRKAENPQPKIDKRKIRIAMMRTARDRGLIVKPTAKFDELEELLAANPAVPKG